MIKFNYLIITIAIMGVIVLFLFPEPENNFLAYAGTALFFIILIIFLTFCHRRKK